MKFLNKFFAFFLLFFSLYGISNSNETIAYIDIDFIIKNSDIGKRTLKKINDQNNKNIEQIKNNEKILKELEIEIASKKNIISKEAFNEEVSIFKEKVNKFKADQKQMIKDFNNYKKNEVDVIFKIISPIINAYMEKKSVKILLDAKNVFMARNDLNLTKDILKEINKEAK